MDADIDRPLRILGARPRRVALLALSRDPGGATVAEVARLLSADPTDATIALRHCHLPKLERRGYVDWDRETGDLSRGPRFAEIEALLDLFETSADDVPFDWP